MIRFTEADFKFLVETVGPGKQDEKQSMQWIRENEQLLDQMLDDPRLAARLLNDDEALVRISPGMLFTILLRRVRRELQQEQFVYEIGQRGERLPIFEAAQIAGLLIRLRDYLVEMLCSFVRTQSGVVYWHAQGKWHNRRFSDLDLDDMAAVCPLVPSEQRSILYKRIADLALFLSGIYPEHASFFDVRPRRSLDTRRTVRDYEQQGQRFYGLAARETAESAVRNACATLSDEFTLARRALNTLSDRYLSRMKSRPPFFPNN